MTIRHDEIKQLWQECFADSDEWTEMFFSKVYRDEDLLSVRRNNRLSSMLLLQRYNMLFHGAEIGAGYICGACTRHSERGKGLMSALIGSALDAARQRGDALCFLIPADSNLYRFYAREGFATVFYTDELYYTSAHVFKCPADYSVIDDMCDPEVYDAFSRMERSQPGRILHSRCDFANILDDTILSDGMVVAVTGIDRRISGIGFAMKRDGMVVVADLLADSDDAAQAILYRVRERFPATPMKILVQAGDNPSSLSPRGMARIVNPGRCLEAIAAANYDFKGCFRIHDPLLRDNCRIYHVADGHVESCITHVPTTSYPIIDIDTFTRAVFDASETTKLPGLPSIRPHLALMLD